MPNLLRKPLPWMVLAECAVVAALVIVAWHLVSSPPGPPLAPPAATSPRADSGETLPVLPGATGEKPGQGPGLNLDATFWRLRLAELNRGQAAFEGLEWKLVRSAMDSAQRYVESVVLPSVARAEHHPRPLR